MAAKDEILHDIYETTEVIPPFRKFKEHGNVNSLELYEKAARNKEDFWRDVAGCLHWFKPFTEILNWQPPHAKWFADGTLNASYNCLDRHITSETQHKTAIVWEGEDGQVRKLSYQELFHEVKKCANVLKNLGIKKGDRIAIYLPMIPEAMVAMLACARIGAIHTVVFGGYSAEALKDRILDADAKLVITADAGIRKGQLIHLKDLVDTAIQSCSCVNHVVVIKFANASIHMQPSRDVWYHELMQQASDQCEAEPMNAEDILFILYTSGTTGKPKGLVHTTGGYMVGVTSTTKWVFDLKPNDIYWCTADIGWVTGHSYVVYGPLSNGATIFIYGGSIDFPDHGRYWQLVEKHRITILYTAPTAIRLFMKWGEELPKKYDLSSLRLLGTVGEPINPEAWLWYYKNIGNKKCPVVDTWWQTETGSILISALPGISSLKPGSATKPLPGIDAAILNDDGKPCNSGLLALTSPWPSMLRGIYNDPQRYIDTYWKKWNNRYYFTGDGAKQDDDGYFWLMGRVDDVLNVSGHRIGTMEVESALVDHHSVAEAAVIGIEDALRGQAIAAFVVLKDNATSNTELEVALKKHVVDMIGALARPQKVIFVADLPKTRSGKIMRRLLRDIAEGHAVGDVTSLTDASVLQKLKILYESSE